MASRLLSAYGGLSTAKSKINKNLADIADISGEMKFGEEGTVSSQMKINKIKRNTATIGMGLELTQQIAGMAHSANVDTEKATAFGKATGQSVDQTYGETKIWDLFTGKTKIGEGQTFWGEVGERMAVFSGFKDAKYDIGGSELTSSQISAGLPYAKAGRSWDEVLGLVGGGENLYKSVSNGPTTKFPGPSYNPSKVDKLIEDTGENIDITGQISALDIRKKKEVDFWEDEVNWVEAGTQDYGVKKLK